MLTGGLCIFRKAFFFAKKKQKTFGPLSRRRRIGARQRSQKFFGSFFQKRTFCTSSAVIPPARNARSDTAPSRLLNRRPSAPSNNRWNA